MRDDELTFVCENIVDAKEPLRDDVDMRSLKVEDLVVAAQGETIVFEGKLCRGICEERVSLFTNVDICKAVQREGLAMTTNALSNIAPAHRANVIRFTRNVKELHSDFTLILKHVECATLAHEGHGCGRIVIHLRESNSSLYFLARNCCLRVVLGTRFPDQ